MKLKFNPFARATHNGFQWPRIAFHILPHFVVGVVSFAIVTICHWPVWLAAVFVLLTALFLKMSWFNWDRSSGKLWHFSWTGRLITDIPDAISDVCLGLLGALMLPMALSPAVILGIYYLLSLFNGT